MSYHILKKIECSRRAARISGRKTMRPYFNATKKTGKIILKPVFFVFCMSRVARDRKENVLLTKKHERISYSIVCLNFYSG